MRLAQETSQNVGSDVICAPPNVSARQLAEAYVRYANQAHTCRFCGFTVTCSR